MMWSFDLPGPLVMKVCANAGVSACASTGHQRRQTLNRAQNDLFPLIRAKLGAVVVLQFDAVWRDGFVGGVMVSGDEDVVEGGCGCDARVWREHKHLLHKGDC
jgi:hypothetical protein